MKEVDEVDLKLERLSQMQRITRRHETAQKFVNQNHGEAYLDLPQDDFTKKTRLILNNQFLFGMSLVRRTLVADLERLKNIDVEEDCLCSS